MASHDNRSQRRERVRREILEAAGRLFAEQGRAHVSIRGIAEAAHYSPATLYLYFEDKEDLLQQICDDAFQQLIDRLEKVDTTVEDPTERLRAGCRAYIDFGLEHPHKYLVTFSSPPGKESCSDKAFDDSTGQRAFSHLVRSVASCVEAGQAPAVDVHATSAYFWAAIHGLTSLLICHQNFPWPNRQVMIDELLSALIRSLQTAPINTA